MESGDTLQGYIMERLIFAERSLVELKESIREKNLQLKQTEEALEEEKISANIRIKNLKLHAKAQIHSLNKCIKEMKAQKRTVLPAEPYSEEEPPKHEKRSKEDEMEVEKIKYKLQEKEELINCLQDQLAKTQAEQQAEQSSTESEEFVLMKQQLQEKEELIGMLKAQLSQTQAEQAAQELRLLQSRVKEQEEMLSSRARVIQFLQRELSSAEERNQTLTEQFAQMETERNTLKETFETEREESKIVMARKQADLAEKNSSAHDMQEEMHRLLDQLEQARQARADLQSQYDQLEIEHQLQLEETAHILSLQKTEQDLKSSCEDLRVENAKILQERREEAMHSAQSLELLEEQLHSKEEEIAQLGSKNTLPADDVASQTDLGDVFHDGTQELRLLQSRVKEQEEMLSSRAHVIQFLQRELSSAEERNQTVSEQFAQMETEHNTLKETFETEREESKIVMARMQADLAEKNSSAHDMKAEMHRLLDQLEQAGQAHADLQSQYDQLEIEHQLQLEEKTQILSFLKTEQELNSACNAIRIEIVKLLMASMNSLLIQPSPTSN